MFAANGTGKSNILRLVEFFLVHGTGNNVKLHWENGDSAWEPHKRCLASLSFELNAVEQDLFSKWRIVAIISLLQKEEHIKKLLSDLEQQDLKREDVTFSSVEVHPEEVANEFDIEECPLFRKLRPYKKSVPRKVELFWELIESALLDLYSTERRPFDHVMYYAHTESRDTSNVVFQQILCSKSDRVGIHSQLESVYVSHQAKFVFPSVCTLALEVSTLRGVLTGGGTGRGGDRGLHESSSSMIAYKGIYLTEALSDQMWAQIESHLKYGLPLVGAVEQSSDRSVFSRHEHWTPTLPVQMSPLDPVLPHLEESRRHEVIQPTDIDPPCSRSESPPATLHRGAVSLVNCGFTSTVQPGEIPPIASLSDVKSWCSRLLRKTERFMAHRQTGCQMEAVRGEVLQRV